MKKVLSLIGIVSISASTGASVLELQTASTNYEGQNKNRLNFVASETSNKFHINEFKNSYNALSKSDKAVVAGAMAKISKLNINEISQYLATSQIDFIRENKATIENMYALYTSMTTLSQTLSVAAQDLNIDWGAINNLIDLNFGDSNDYTPIVDTYGPEHWWTAIWDWGWKIDFPEGDINVMRVVKLVISLYDGINFKPLEALISSGKDFFDYLVNLDLHDDDKVAVLYDLLVKTGDDFKNSGVPFTNQFYDIVNKFTSILKPFQNVKLGVVKNIIKTTVEKQLGMSLEQIGKEYSGYIDLALNILVVANDILFKIKDSLPGIIWDFIFNSISDITNQMVAADLNHNGVYLKFQQFIIPLGFTAR